MAPASSPEPADRDQRVFALDTVAAARSMSLSVTWLEQMRLKGNGPKFIKLGRRVLYRPADIEAWLDEHTRRSTSDVR